jgi:hypothetical protein
MSYPLTTRVLIDGLEAAASGSDLAAGRPTLVGDLSIQWGRQSNVDQPDVSTCTFALREQLHATVTPMLDVIRTGAPVEVWSKATIPVTDSEVMSDTGFTVAGPLDPNSFQQVAGETTTLAVDVERIQGRTAAWVTAAEDSWSADVVFPPAEFQAAGQNPDAWDTIPRLLPGQQWPVTLSVWLPVGAAATLTAYAYTDPHSGTPAQCTVVNPDNGLPVSVVADGAWHDVQGVVSVPGSVDEDGAWVAPGLSFTTMPSQLQVKDVPGTIAEQQFTFADYTRAGISFLSVTQAAPSVRDVLVWKGRVTSATGQAAGPFAMTVSVTASDAGSKYANKTISDSPWPLQPLGTRMARIATLAGAPAVAVDDSLVDINLAYKEVDAQQVLDLMKDCAQSVGGVMWVASHATADDFLWLEDPASRAAVRKFIIDDTTGMVSIGGNGRDTSVLSATDMITLDGVQWVRDVLQDIDSVDVGWLQQSTDTDGTVSTDEQTVTLTEDGADLSDLTKLSVSSELASAADATDLAERLLAMSQNTDWMASGLTLDTRRLQVDLAGLDYVQRLTAVLDLLDGTVRLGRGLVLTDMPAWTPAGSTATAYVEGGTYTLSKGAWQLQLIISSSGTGGGNSSARLADFPDGVTVADFPDGMRFEDTYGVAGPNFGLDVAVVPFTLPALVQ